MRSKTLIFHFSLYVSVFFQLKTQNPTLSFISQFIKPNDLVFDVGAHIGKKTEGYLDVGCKVICFEPQPECAHILRNKFYDNKSIVIEEVGLGSHESELEMYVCSNATTISTFSPEWVNDSRFSQLGYVWDKKITVPIKTLDQMIKKYGLPQFCKIDVENYEFEVLKGLTTPIPFISFEVAIETFDNTIHCLEYLENLGYKKFNCAFAEIPHFIFNDWSNRELFLNKLQNHLNSMEHYDKTKIWGDVYASYY